MGREAWLVFVRLRTLGFVFGGLKNLSAFRYIKGAASFL